MPVALLALAGGMLALRLMPGLPPGWLLILITVCGALLVLRGWRVGLFLLGLAWACFSAQLALDDRLADALDGRTLWLEGRVAGLPEQGEGVVRFELVEAQSRRAELPRRIRLSWHGGPELRSGERWRLAVRLRQPHGGVNPQSFEYEAWLLAQRIGATGTVKQGERLQAADSLGGWRDQLRRQVLSTPAWGREGALAALVLGDGSGLSSADWALLQASGTVHLMVISGQHVALLAGFVYLLVAGLARIGLWPPRWPWLPVACLASLGMALGYGWLAGFEVPVQRACIMLALVLFWRWRFRQLGLWLPFLLALNLVLLAEPLVVLQAGFWLSFAAVAVLILTFGGRLGAWGWLRSWGRAQWCMALGLLPPLLALGLPVSVSGPLANLIAVPWVGLLVVPLALLGTLLLPVPWLGEGMLWLAGGLLELLFRLLGWLAEVAPAWLPTELSPLRWTLVALGSVLLLLPGGVPLRLPGLVLALGAFLARAEGPPQGQAEVWMFDVGQGQAVLVRTREHALLYDAGPQLAGFDSGERIVLPSLARLGVRRLDQLLLSHADQDHAGGAAALLAGLPVETVVSGESERLPADWDVQPCAHGQRWEWDGVQFRTLRWSRAGNGNQASCLLLVDAGGERLLLTGDIDAQAERALLREGADLRAHWLLAPHHGSRSSSSAVFLNAVAAHSVLISRGRYNPFGHPHPQVLARYQQRGMTILDTSEQGAVRLQLGRFEEAFGLRRQPRFWREK